MTVNVVLTQLNAASEKSIDIGDRVQVHVRVERVVLTVEAATHVARTWLAENVDERLGIATPELLIDEDLYWRFAVVLAAPNEVQPGSGTFYGVGQMRLHAATGEIADAGALAAELRAHVASLAA